MENLPKIEVVSGAGESETLALGWFKGTGKDKKLEFVGERDKALEELEKRLNGSRHFTAKKKEADLLRFYRFNQAENVVLLGLGSRKDVDGETYRQAGGALYQLQKRSRLDRVGLRTDSVLPGEEKAGEYLQAFAEGYWLAAYDYDELKKKEAEAFSPSGLELVGLKAAGAKKAVEKGRKVAEAVNFARSLGDRPANHLTPAILAGLAQEKAKKYGMKCTVLGRKEIEREKMGLLLGVAQGSEEEPRFIVLEYQGGKKGEKPVALVGKGITFDTGGISIKPASKMEEMKYDMMGAAAVLGTMQAVAALKLPLNVTGYVAAAENMPDGRAQKPGDVQRSLSGKTVEIVNTDAEGRLILADAIEYAQREKPQAIFDFATLTGAVVVALGSVTSGIMGNHPELIDRLKEAAQVTGERVWELPLYAEYEEDLKSHYADIKNSGVRDAGSSKGGVFLKFFVEEKMPWVHCDIAGTAWGRKDVNYLSSKYGTGVMVRTMAHLLETWKPLRA